MGTEQQKQSEATPRRHWFSSQARALVLTILASVVLLVAALPWYLSTPGMMSRIVARAVPDLVAEVTFDHVRIGWLGPIRLDGIRVVPQDGTDPPLEIRRIEVSNGFALILITGGDLGRVRVDGVEADVVFTADRTSNFGNLFAETEPQPAGPATGGGRRRSLVSMRLEVADARVRIAGPWSPEPWASDPIDIRATLGPAQRGWHSEWTIEPVQLLAHARLEPSVASSVLAYIAPVLADATRTGGEFSLRLNGATLPVGDPADGTLAGVLSMHRVDLGPGPLAVKTLQELPFRLPPPPTVRFADEANVDFRLGERRIWHTGLEFGIPLKQPGLRLDVHSSGSVGLDDDSLDLKLELPIPGALPQDRPVIASLAGRKISVGVGGTLDEPKVVFDGSIKETAGAALAEVLERLRRPGTVPQRGDAEVMPHGAPPVDANAQLTTPPSEDEQQPPEKDPATSALEGLKAKLPPELSQDPTADAVIDLVGDVLQQVAKRRAERRAAEAANPNQEPPRGPRRRRPLPAE
jgi:hypothetical protein